MRLHREVSGRGGRTLVLCNALGTTTALWDPQADALGRAFRVVRYDMRGHGESPAGSVSSVADLAGDVLELLDDLEVARASIAGISIGASVAAWLGAHAPDRVDRLVLACTSATFGEPEGWLERAAVVRQSGIEPIAEASLERWFTAQTRIEQPATVEHFREALVAVDHESYAGCCEALAELDLTADLARITAPALVIAGGDDTRTPPGEVQLMAAGIGGAQLAVIEGAAHLANIDQPAEFTRLMLGHLGKEQV
jgi:3-oxoadipate enol-lactonase